MAKRVVEDSTMTAIGDAIRKKAGTTAKMLPLNMPSAILSIDSGVFTKVGSMECGYNKTTLNITAYSWYKNITAEDIYFVPQSFTVTATGQITAGTYNINISYTSGVITAWRDSVPGQVGVAFAMDVYVYIKSKQLTGVGKMVKVAESQPLAAGAGCTVDVSTKIAEYAKLTANDFFLDLKKLDINATTTGSGAATVVKTYDPSTGIFNFSRSSIQFSGSMQNYCDVYVFVPV